VLINIRASAAKRSLGLVAIGFNYISFGFALCNSDILGGFSSCALQFISFVKFISVSGAIPRFFSSELKELAQFPSKCEAIHVFRRCEVQHLIMISDSSILLSWLLFVRFDLRL
jgi:hypothetical protein